MPEALPLPTACPGSGRPPAKVGHTDVCSACHLMLSVRTDGNIPRHQAGPGLRERVAG